MPFVPVPKDLNKIKTKVALNLTKRQLICFSLAAAVGIPTYLLTRGAIGSESAVLVMIVLMLPFFFMAMYERDGQPAEKIIRNVLRVRLWPGTRPYKTENMYSVIAKEGGNLDKDHDKTAGATDKAPVRKCPAGTKDKGRIAGNAR